MIVSEQLFSLSNRRQSAILRAIYLTLSVEYRDEPRGPAARHRSRAHLSVAPLPARDQSTTETPPWPAAAANRSRQAPPQPPRARRGLDATRRVALASPN